MRSNGGVHACALNPYTHTQSRPVSPGGVGSDRTRG